MLAVAYQYTDDALVFELPETGALISLGVEVMEVVSLVFEYANDDDYDVADGGSGEDTDVFTVQVGVEF